MRAAAWLLLAAAPPANRALILPGGPCVLTSLQVWAEGSRLHLAPPFAPHVYGYSVVVDYHADVFWIEAEAVGVGNATCQCRRSDGGVAAHENGRLTVAVAGTDGMVQREYSISLRRRSATEDELRGLVIAGGEALDPLFWVGTPEYSTRAAVTMDAEGRGGDVEVSITPVDMGQGLRIFLDKVDGTPVLHEVPLGLSSLLYRIRNFTLGKVGSFGTRLQLAGAGMGATMLDLPVRVRIDVWPPVAAPTGVVIGAGRGQGPPRRSYFVNLEPAPDGYVFTTTTTAWPAGAEVEAGMEVAEEKEVSGGRASGSMSEGLKIVFSLSIAGLLAGILVSAVRFAPHMPPQLRQAIERGSSWILERVGSSEPLDDPSSPRAQVRAEDEVRRRFRQARGPPRDDAEDLVEDDGADGGSTGPTLYS
mmetsp:Transcript_100363/g.321823  ORF Transcript_100363/g.321823 Transcript_100363/m.321823 type:complete len:419 (+) Transcript_100363:105-1361(+)